jgi:uncharacterized damage-inducible protein DinB
MRRPPAAVLSLVAVLRQLAELIDAMTDEQYREKPVGVVSSNVGGHVRHSLDHIDALLSAVESSELDYDQRLRGTDVETSREAALAVLGRQEQTLRELAGVAEKQRLHLTMIVSSALPPVVVETTVGRELGFVLSHTIHHNALIAVMAKTLGVAVPERFGYAPSTLAHLEKTACVR